MGLVEGRRLSWLRVAVVLVVAAGAVVGSLRGWQWFQDSRVEVEQTQWFAGYVDVTTTPSYGFEDPVDGTGPSAVLSFVVAHEASTCRPSWGGAYSLAEADRDLDLARRIARVEQRGGVPVISFGGQANTELAVACTDEQKLFEAYRSVLQRYDVSVIDLDVEGEALDDTAATARRAAVMARLQRDHEVAVWLTLPVDPRGLTPAGRDVVATMLSAGVELAGVNAMTMNFGASKEPGDSMAQASISALTTLHEQLDAAYSTVGERRTRAQLWSLIGATVMIGQNDVAGEIFTLDDAAEVKAFAARRNLGRLSLWSLNRDRTCSNNWPDVTRVSTSCSGLNQQAGAFARTLGAKVLSGPEVALTPTPSMSPTREPTDDPATSPYPVWNQARAFQAGERVVWRRNVYVATWWTSGDVPDDPTVPDSAAPWRLIGPVLPGDTPEPLPTVAPGTYPAWRPQVAYEAGQRVQLGSLGYVALWWTQGDSPDAPATRDSPSPWRRLGTADLTREGVGAAQRSRSS